MRLYKFLFYKTHGLLYPIMADVNKMMSQWIVSGFVSLAIFINLIELMAFVEINFDLGIGFSSKVNVCFDLYRHPSAELQDLRPSRQF